MRNRKKCLRSECQNKVWTAGLCRRHYAGSQPIEGSQPIDPFNLVGVNGAVAGQPLSEDQTKELWESEHLPYLADAERDALKQLLIFECAKMIDSMLSKM